jgi:acyl carrier protein
MKEKIWEEIKEGIKIVFEGEGDKFLSKFNDLLKAKKEKTDFTFKEVGIDSIDQMKLLIFFEDKFNFHVNDDELLKIKTINDFINVIKKNVPSLRS